MLTLVIVKCKECGQEYELERGQRSKDFQCECGGDLRILTFKELRQKNKDKHQKDNNISSNGETPSNKSSPGKPDKPRKSWSEQSTGIKVLSIIIVFVVFLGIVGVISGLMGSSEATYNDSLISFSYPNSWNISGGNTSDGGESLEGKEVKLYFIFEIHPVSSEYPTDLETWKNLVKTELGETPEETGDITIDGINGAYVILSDTAWYYVTKDNMAYELTFYRNTISDSEMQNILDSIQIN